jgi:hypothetical protein
MAKHKKAPDPRRVKRMNAGGQAPLFRRYDLHFCNILAMDGRNIL